MDSGEKRLNELGYMQELRRDMVCLKPSISQNSHIYFPHFLATYKSSNHICYFSLKHISYLYQCMSGLVKNLTILIHAFFLFLFFSLGFLQTVFKTLAITLSFMAVFSGTPLYGPSLLYVGPASLIWGWVVVSFFTWFVGLALAEICSSFQYVSCL